MRPTSLAAAALLAWLGSGAALAGAAGETLDPAVAAADDAEEADAAEVDEEQIEDLVADAQRLLSLSGYDPGPVDGQFGPRTQLAIRAYQAAARRHGTLEAIKGPPPDDATPRPELVGLEQPAPDRAQ